MTVTSATQEQPLVGIIMGSDSDWPVMQDAVRFCEQMAVPYEAKVVSAHRTPRDMMDYAESAHSRGLKVIIAGAGGAAHLPGMVASLTPLPVIGVPVPTRSLSGMDSLLSIVQMPNGVPVATVAIGAARNAGILAVQIVATHSPELLDKLKAFKAQMAEESRKKNETLLSSKA
jgi:5-(carboxyamino)imidazole ribonucleotide mutase